MGNWRRPSATWIAVTYGVLATLITLAFSAAEGTLWVEQRFSIKGEDVVQYPYVRNVSTILDFAVLNPLAIFFTLKAREGYQSAFSHFKKGGEIPAYHKFGLAFVSGMVGVSTMWFYFSSFIGQDFYTEAFAPNGDAGARVTITGWSIFVFTAPVIAIIAFAIFEFGNYLRFVIALDAKEFAFRLPPAMADDFKIAVKPCIYAAYILFILFVVLAVFLIRDYLQYDIEESQRIWLLAPYMCACLIVFIPFFHMHQIMKSLRSEVVEGSTRLIEKRLGLQGLDHAFETNVDGEELIKSVDEIQKLQAFHASIPTWPTTSGAVFLPNLSFVISVLALLYKMFELAVDVV